ncbi:class I SAM-dependent methyltransferase [Halomonas binhaiensis]|uniref:Methyltransferase domain-containing protein n=1 Tax=Halomonas binhaiensis TaxID=2562282 RepID=A0A5C1NJQ0_9GAMM|nr:class I SAM-dependent methyltransferase [Halomonas binhaiensis]QEM82863.1 methyltransferase domain-containing protein [Halomonas binhaiensis]
MRDQTLSGLSQHYAGNDQVALIDRLREAFVEAGINPDQLTPTQMAGLDQLHLGGRGSSQRLLELSELSGVTRMLDVGCGTGGASRLLAQALGCEVVGVDITPAFIDVARWLSQASGLSLQTHFLCADAAELPLASDSIEALWCQHALLNMPDQDAVLNEWRRILIPGGRVLLHEVVAGENPEPLSLPVPWARQPEHSHLDSRQALEQRLQHAGFRQLRLIDVTEQALSWRRHHGRREQQSAVVEQVELPGAQLLFGEDFPSMGRNLQANLANDRVRVIQGVWGMSGEPLEL